MKTAITVAVTAFVVLFFTMTRVIGIVEQKADRKISEAIHRHLHDHHGFHPDKNKQETTQ